MSSVLDWLLSYVHGYIEDFVEPIYGDQLSFGGILLGKLVIENVQLKQKVFDAIPLPLLLHFQYIGKIKISIPIWSLFTAPISIEISDVLLVVGSQALRQWNTNDADAWQQQYRTAKKGMLAGNEAAAFVQSMEDGFLWRTALKIGTNVKVSVKNVQIRLEDWYGGAYALGVNIADVNVGPVHEEVCPTASETYSQTGRGAYSDANIVRKQIDIKGLAVYCDSLLFENSPPARAKLGSIQDARKKCIALQPSHRIRGLALGRPLHVKTSDPPDDGGGGPKKFKEDDDNEDEEHTEDPDKPNPGLVKSIWSWVRGQAAARREVEDESSPTKLLSDPTSTITPVASGAAAGRPQSQNAPLHKIWHVAEHYTMDGRWPYRDLLSNFCEIRVYVPGNGGSGHWRRVEDVLNELSASTATFAQDEQATKATQKLGMLLEALQENMKTEMCEGQIDKSHLPPDIDPMKKRIKHTEGVNDNHRSHKKHGHNKRFQPSGSAEISQSDLVLPSLRVKRESVEEFKSVLRDMLHGYHQYILAPQDLTTVLSLCLLPVEHKGQASLRSRTTEATRNFLVKSMNLGKELRSGSAAEDNVTKAWHQRIFSWIPKWSKKPEEKENMEEMQELQKRLELDMNQTSGDGLNLLPMCRIDVDLKAVRMTVSIEQIRHLMAWVDVYVNLYGSWSMALRSCTEKARPPFAPTQLYLDAWLIKMCLLKGAVLPDDLAADKPTGWPVAGLTESQRRIILWCHNFEMAYNTEAILALRREALDRWRQNSLQHGTRTGIFAWCKRQSSDDKTELSPDALSGHVVSGVGNKQIDLSAAENKELRSIYADAITELHSIVIRESTSHLKKFVFSTDAFVNVFLSDIQVYVDVGTTEVTYDLAVLVESVSLGLMIKSDKPSGYMGMNLDLYTTTVACVSNFAAPVGPIPIETLDTNSAQHQEELKKARNRLLEVLASGRVLPESDTLKFTNETAQSKRFGRFTMHHAHGHRENASAHILLMIHRAAEKKTPSLSLKLGMHTYRLPDIPDMEVEMALNETVTVVCVVEVIMSLLSRMVSVFDAMHRKNLYDLYEICKKCDIERGRQFLNDYTVGDLPHTSMKLKAFGLAHPAIPGGIINVCLAPHPLNEGLVFSVKSFDVDTPYISPRKSILESVYQPLKYQQDILSAKVFGMYIYRSESCLTSIVEHQRTFLGIDSPVDFANLTRHYHRHSAPSKLEPSNPSSELSYVLYPFDVQECLIRTTHLPARYSAPAMHLDAYVARIALELNTYDIVLLSKIGASAGAMYAEFGPQLSLVLQRMANSTAQSEYIIKTVKPPKAVPTGKDGSKSPKKVTSRRTSVANPITETDAKPDLLQLSKAPDITISGEYDPRDVILDSFLNEADLNEILGAQFVTTYFVHTGEIPTKVPETAFSKPLQEEGDMERWGRMSRHVEFYDASQLIHDASDVESETSAMELVDNWTLASDLLPKGPQLWLPRDASFTLMHIKVGQISLLVCEADNSDDTGLTTSSTGDTNIAVNGMLLLNSRIRRKSGSSDSGSPVPSKAHTKAWDPAISYPPSHYAFNKVQKTEPLLSVHIGHLTSVVGLGGNPGDIAVSACIGNIRMNDETAITPLNMSYLYFTAPDLEYVQPCIPTPGYVRNWCGVIQDENLRTLLGSQHHDPDVEMPLIQDPLRELVYYSDWYARECVSGHEFLSEQQNLPQHIRINLVGNLATFRKVYATVDISPLRLTLPLEFVDELTDFTSNLALAMVGINEPVTSTDDAQSKMNVTLPPFQPVRFRHLSEDSPDRYPQLPLPPINPVKPTEDRLIQSGHIQVRVSAIEILIPNEPIRLPQKGPKKKAKFDLDSVDVIGDGFGSNDFTDSPALTAPLTNEDRELALRTINRWRTIIHRTIRGQSRGMGAALSSKNKTSLLPKCLAIRCGVNIDTALYGYQSTLKFPIELRPLFDQAISVRHEQSIDDMSPSKSVGVLDTSQTFIDHDTSRKFFRFRRTLESYRWVEACIRAPVSNQPLIRQFCPGQIHVNMSIESVTIDFVRPSCWSAFGVPRLYWKRQGVMSNIPQLQAVGRGAVESEDTSIVPLVSPFAVNVTVRLGLPSEREMYERFYGFSRIESTSARRLFGIPDENPPEFVNLDLSVSPIGVSANESTICEIIKLMSVVNDFNAHLADKNSRVALMTQMLIRYDASLEEESDTAATDTGVTPTTVPKTFIPPATLEEPKAAALEDESSPSTIEDSDPNDIGSYTDWVVDAGVPPELGQGLFGYNIATSWDSVNFKIEVGLIRVTLWDCDLDPSQQRNADRPTLLDLTITSILLVGQCRPVNSLSQPHEWWYDINSGEQLLAGTDLIALSFVSYDFDPLLKNPYRIKPIAKKGLYHVLKNVLKNYYAAYAQSKQSQNQNTGVDEEMDLTFRGRLRDVDSKIATSLPWFSFNGRLVIGISCNTGNAAGAGSKEFALLEPFSIEFVGGKRNPKSNLHVTSEITWINLTISLFLLEAWLKFAVEILCQAIPEGINRLKLASYERCFNKRMIKYGGGHLPSVKQSASMQKSSRFIDMDDGQCRYPSFMKVRTGAINSTRRWVLGRTRPLRPSMIPENWNGTNYQLRPIGAWDPHKALADALTAMTQMLGTTFFTQGRQMSNGQFLTNTDFPLMPDQIHRTSGAAAADFAALLLNNVAAAPAAKQVPPFQSVNLLGQPIAVYTKSAQPSSPSLKSHRISSENGFWQVVPPEGLISIPVYLDGQQLLISEFCIRFRLLNEIFELRSTAELRTFVEVIQDHYNEELLSQRQGKVIASHKPKGRIHYFTINLSSPKTRASDEGAATTGTRKGSAELLREQSDRIKVVPKKSRKSGLLLGRKRKSSVVKPLKTALSETESRPKIHILVRLRSCNGDSRLMINDSGRSVNVQTNFKLMISSGFTARNMTQESLCLVNMPPFISPSEPEVLTKALSDSRALETYIEQPIKSTFNHWLESRELISLLYRLTPPPPPIDCSEPDWTAHSTEATTSARLALVLDGPAIINDYIDISEDDEDPKSSRWIEKVHQLRRLALHTKLVDGVSCLLLPPNIANTPSVGDIGVSETTLEGHTDHWPSRCPRVYPLHWLLAKQSYIGAVDMKSLKAGRIDFTSKLPFLTKTTLNISSESSTRKEVDPLQHTNRHFILALLNQKDKVNPVISFKELNRLINHFENLTSKSDLATLTRYVHKLDPKPKILKLSVARRLGSEISPVLEETISSPTSVSGAIHTPTSRPELSETRFYSLSQAIVAPDAFMMAGDGICYQTIISPLFEISNRLPRSINVSSAKMSRKLAKLNKTEGNQVTGSTLGIADNASFSVSDNILAGVTVNAGENKLLPLSDTGMEFTFGSVKTLGSVSVDIHTHEQENLELICRRISEQSSDLNEAKKARRSYRIADLKETLLSGGGTGAGTTTDALSKSEIVMDDGIPPDEDFYISLEVSPTNVQAIGCGAGRASRPRDTESVVINCRSFMKTLTLFSDLWIVNRMNYPLGLKCKPPIDLMPHKRVVATSILSRTGTARLCIDKRTFGSIPGSRFFIRQDRGDVFKNDAIGANGLASIGGAGGLTGGFVSTGHHHLVVSNPIKLSSSSLSVSLPIFFPATDTTPALSHILWIARSPSPFIRTSTAEILPAYVVANDSSQVTLYVRESPYKQNWLKDKTVDHGAFVAIPPGGRIEFHPQRKKKIKIQISGLQEVETFHHVVLQQTTAQKTNLNDADAPLWSQPIEISNAQLLQVRYPTVEPPSPLSIGAFDLVDVSVTMKNGVRLISLMPTHLPEYRFCNLTSLPIGIAQHNLDGPFEILKPYKALGILADEPKPSSQIEKVVGSWETSRLTNVSIPFNLYDRTLPSTLEFWVCTKKPTPHKTKGRGEDHNDKRKKDKASTQGGLSEPADGRIKTSAGHGAAKVVLKKRRQIGGSYAMNYNEKDLNESMLIHLVGGNKRPEDLSSQLEFAYSQMSDITDQDLKMWNHQKKLLSRLFDLNKHFDQMRRRKLSGGNLTDRLVFLPLSDESFAPVRIKLRFVSGVKWLIFENFQGAIPKVPRHEAGRRSVGGGGSTVANPQNNVVSAEEESLRRKVHEMWIQMQTEPKKMANELATLCKYSDVQLNEMRKIYPYGNAEAKTSFTEAYERIAKTQFIHDLASTEDSTPAEHQDGVMTGPAPSLNTSDKVTAGDDAYEIEAIVTTGKKAKREDDDVAIAESDLIINPLDNEVPEISTNFAADIRLDGFGIDVVNSRCSKDLIYISVARIALSCYSDGASEIFKLMLSIGWCQIDATSNESYYPTVLRPIRDVHHNASRADGSTSNNGGEGWNITYNSSVEQQRKQPQIILPGESSHGLFAFDDPHLFDPLLLQRFGGSERFEFLRVVLENRIPQPVQDTETMLQKFAEYIQNTEKAEKQAELNRQHPMTGHSELQNRRKENEGSSIFVQQLGAVTLPPQFGQDTGGATLLDIPLCAVDICPIAINVDYPLIQALMKLMDHALVILDNYSLDLVQGDPSEIQQSERQPYSAPWKKFLGGTESLFTTKAVLLKISLSSLDIGEIQLILNINLGSTGLRRKSSKNNNAYVQDTVSTRSEDWDDSATTSNMLVVKKSSDTTHGLIHNFVSANADPAISAEGDLAPGIRNDDDQPIQSELVKAILGVLQLKASMSDAQIQLPSMQYRDITGPSDEVAMEIITPYITKAAKQVAKVLGAIDLLGNPALVFRHCSGGLRRAATEIRFGCFRSTASYERLHPSVAIRSRLWQQPCLAVFFAARHFAVGITSALLEGISRCLGSWTLLLETVARNGDVYSLQPGASSGVNSGSIADQPASLFEGVRMGLNTGMYLAGLSIANAFVKPFKGLARAFSKKTESESVFDEGDSDSEDSREEESLIQKTCSSAGTVGCSVLSAVGSCVCGLPTALCACCSFTAGGALQNIIKIPMLSGVRSRRTFFRPAGNNTFVTMRQYESHYALWSALGSSPARLSRFLGISRSNQLLKMFVNVVFSIPLAILDLKNGQPSPGVLLIGTQKMGLVSKRGVHWQLPWRRLESVDFVVFTPTSQIPNLMSTYITATRFTLSGKSVSEETYAILNAEPMIGWDQFLLISRILLDLTTPAA